jgi:integration host factor subunit beta
MIKSELIQLISSKQPHLSHDDVSATVTLIINKLINELTNGGRVEIRGFGAFSLKQRKARLGRNPRTGVMVSVPPKHAVYFKPGAILRERVNGSAAQYKISD